MIKAVVVGGGVIGTSVAFQLAQTGSQVILLEAGQPASGTSSTSFAWMSSNVPSSASDRNCPGDDYWAQRPNAGGNSRSDGWGRLHHGHPSEVLAVQSKAFVEASRASGATTPHILMRQILPNTFAVMTVMTTYTIARFILIESSISFLGMGVVPPSSSGE